MSVWSIWTWISIGVLAVGSAAVFVWFLMEIVRVRREILADERPDRVVGRGRVNDGE